MGMGKSTIGTQLLSKGGSETAYSKICNIKTYPDLGGAPDTLETTDLEDTHQTFCLGVQSQDNMEFTANYTLAAYKAAVAVAGTQRDFQLKMGNNGEDGIFEWSGVLSVHVTGGDVNSVREMVISIVPNSAVTETTT